jgi:hypothetical protein
MHADNSELQRSPTSTPHSLFTIHYSPFATDVVQSPHEAAVDDAGVRETNMILLVACSLLGGKGSYDFTAIAHRSSPYPIAAYRRTLEEHHIEWASSSGLIYVLYVRKADRDRAVKILFGNARRPD